MHYNTSVNGRFNAVYIMLKKLINSKNYGKSKKKNMISTLK